MAGVRAARAFVALRAARADCVADVFAVADCCVADCCVLPPRGDGRVAPSAPNPVIKNTKINRIFFM